MSDILKRSYAPIADQAWAEIDAEAVRLLKTQLTVRKVVDLNGPFGWDFGAIDLGRLDIKKGSAKDGVHWGVRKILPLVEVRIPFSLKFMELDCISRGAADADLGPLQAAASKAAQFEDEVVYHGFSGGNIKGLVESSSHTPVKLAKDPSSWPKNIMEAVQKIRQQGILGPFNLVLGTEQFSAVFSGADQGYPLSKRIKNIIEGDMLAAPSVKGGVLLASRGGDFELTVGQDFSIGYASHTREDIELYFTQSLYFRVLEPAAVVVLQ